MSYELSPREAIMNIVDLVERSSIRTDIAENLADVLKGLIVSVPRSVARWFESLPEEEKQLDRLNKLNKRMYLPQNVYDQLNGQNDNFYTIVKNMILFGYDEVQEVIIKSPSTWDTQETYYVYKEYDGGDCYFISGYIGDATRFTLEEAKKVMQLLLVDWELEEVQGMKDLSKIIDNLKSVIYYNADRKQSVIEAFEYLQSLKPPVPKFVADWYNENFNDGVDYMINTIRDVDLADANIYDWFELMADNGKFNTYDIIEIIIVKMYLFGYEVMEWNQYLGSALMNT